jgi:UDP-N-acetylglucosamine 2-epimerase
VTLTEPLGYLDFTASLANADLVLTDSGGVQEEAPSLGKPVLVLRETTERPEAIEAGVARLVGTNPDAVHQAAAQLLDDGDVYSAWPGQSTLSVTAMPPNASFLGSAMIWHPQPDKTSAATVLLSQRSSPSHLGRSHYEPTAR